MKKFVVVDVETTIKNKGNPFTIGNRLCYVGLHSLVDGNKPMALDVRENVPVELIQAELNKHDVLIAFNAKFDCHWLEKEGLDLSKLRIWDCQYAEFIFEAQRNPYPSLDKTATKYGLPNKLDVVSTEYWEKGIDTIDIPPEIMVQYLYQDLEVTKQVFEKQYDLFVGVERGKYRLFLLHMEDQTTLRVMERNGILYDVKRSLVMEKNAQADIERVEAKLMDG